MRIIEGFEPAKALLERQPGTDFAPDSPALRQRMKQVFGTEMSPEQAVAQIVDDVRSMGDSALFSYSLKIDRAKLSSLEVSKTQIKRAYVEVDKELLSALKFAAGRIGSFHQKQKDAIRSLTAKKGFGQLIRPIERIGAYAPGGTASYPSTVLMTAIPARIAGVKEVILATPPHPDGTVPAATLVAADIAGVDRIFSVGGAQAIAALAFGTETIPRVDKICGPGNIFVVLAKKLVYGAVGIDSLPGPSEVLIIADENADYAYCAADILAQAEHDPLAAAILVTDSIGLAAEVNKEVERQLKSLDRRDIAAEALRNQGLIAVVDDIGEAIELANLYAPEHLSLMVKGADAYVERITNAGCIFIGNSSTVVLGDYTAGPSHVLPTSATARFSSPLNILDFVKLINVVDVDKGTLKKLAKAAAVIARAEGLEAHARAVEKRLK
ncbi:MAG: histidinol dehydrogenase [Dehalococcoidia bacterium]|nr:MAG: histidinol dehydrogenase [Dehalococcoidia bacterium]